MVPLLQKTKSKWPVIMAVVYVVFCSFTIGSIINTREHFSKTQNNIGHVRSSLDINILTAETANGKEIGTILDEVEKAFGLETASFWSVLFATGSSFLLFLISLTKDHNNKTPRISIDALLVNESSTSEPLVTGIHLCEKKLSKGKNLGNGRYTVFKGNREYTVFEGTIKNVSGGNCHYFQFGDGDPEINLGPGEIQEHQTFILVTSGKVSSGCVYTITMSTEVDGKKRTSSLKLRCQKEGENGIRLKC